jgi:predicted DNA-binding protein
MAKLTFSLDDETVQLLRRVAERSGKPQSLIVREAVAQYAAREEMLSDADRERLLMVLQQIKTRPGSRTAVEVDRELQELRRARRTGWSRAGR